MESLLPKMERVMTLVAKPIDQGICSSFQAEKRALYCLISVAKTELFRALSPFAASRAP